MSEVLSRYLDLLDSQRESAFATLERLSDSEVWQRPDPHEWSIGEILNHNYLLFASLYPVVKRLWDWLGWYGRLRRKRPYRTDTEDLYRDPNFPHWVGFLWTPRHTTRKPVPLQVLKTELEEIHSRVRAFYQGKDEDVLGNLHLYDPLFGWANLIVSLRIGIYHDQLHYDDVLRQAAQFRG